MIKIYDESSGTVYGSITEEQLQFLIGELEEESLEDTDYYISEATLDMFEVDGADPDLLKLLHKALGNRPDMDIRWSRS